MIAGNEISLEDSIAHKEAAQLLTNGVPHCTFVNALGNIDISSEARKFGSSLVNSLATRIAVNFYIRFNKPPKPTRLFTNSEDAFSWLLYKKQEFDQAQSGL